MQTFTQWISLPENRSALAAVERVADGLRARRSRRAVNPLFLYGPSGCGKSHLVAALLARVVEQTPDATASLLTARDFELMVRPEEANGPSTAREDLDAARQADLVIVEDVQQLPERVAEAFAVFVDRRQAREQPLVLTANAGPALLTHLPGRLTSRFASGLVVGVETLSVASRLMVVEELARRRQLGVARPVLEWLADNLAGSVRQLDGALNRAETLTTMHGVALTPDNVAEHFRTEAETHRPTVERIAQRVGRYFRVDPRQMQSASRSRQALLPRQVGMYLARRLTGLSLQQIGAFFGGRDHTTVLHACRKVERALGQDVNLSGAVRQLHADLA
jgi:chromosomal replication initiator protein